MYPRLSVLRLSIVYVRFANWHNLFSGISLCPTPCACFVGVNVFCDLQEAAATSDETRGGGKIHFVVNSIQMDELTNIYSILSTHF